MSAEGYFKAAAHNLRQAAQAKKTEANELRRSMAQLEKEKKGHIDTLKMEERLKQASVVAVEDNGHKARLVHDAISLHTKAKETEKEIGQMKQEMAQAAAAMEQEASNLAKQASQYDGRS